MNLAKATTGSVPPTAVGDPEQWVDLYGDYLFRYALMRLRDKEAARDAVQETFLAGIRNLKSFDGRVDIKYWLRGILKFKVVDHIRKASREQTIDDRDDANLLDGLLFRASGIPTMRPEPWQFDPRSAFDHEGFWPVFEACLAKLKEPVRQAFVMKMIDEIDSGEVCKVLGVTPNHLWVLNHRARTQLKKCLEAKWDRT